MKATVEISPYIDGRYNSEKLRKLKAELEQLFSKAKTREHQKFPEEGLDITISMSAKYQTPYIKVEGWGEYQSVGEFEDLVMEALDNRGFEVTGQDGDETSFRIDFE